MRTRGPSGLLYRHKGLTARLQNSPSAGFVEEARGA
jgi:hypothetical protein